MEFFFKKVAGYGLRGKKTRKKPTERVRVKVRVNLGLGLVLRDFFCGGGFFPRTAGYNLIKKDFITVFFG